MRNWLAIGIDTRPESWRDHPWRHGVPQLADLVVELGAAGVRRFVLSHASGRAAPSLIDGLGRRTTAELVVAGGIDGLDELQAVRDAGAAAVILGEVIFTGRVDLAEALRVAA